MTLKGKGIFNFRGHKTSDFGMIMSAVYKYNAPQRDVTVIEVPGRNGEIVIDNGRYKAVDWEVDFRVNSSTGDVEKLLNNISNWLSAMYSPQKLLFDNEPEYQYLASINDKVTFSRINSKYATGSVTFRLQPIKYFIKDMTATKVINGDVFKNTGTIPAKPIIKIVGTGNGVFKFGKASLTLKNVTGGVVIDSELETIVTLDGEPAYREMTSYPFPNLQVGNNSIAIPAGFTVEITPRTGVIV